MNPIEIAMHQLQQWNFSISDSKLVFNLLSEWYSDRPLNSVLNQWEKDNSIMDNSVKVPLKIMCYNVQGWGTRALEVIELVYKIEASICVLTEVGELWNTNEIPHFNMFYQRVLIIVEVFVWWWESI